MVDMHDDSQLQHWFYIKIKEEVLHYTTDFIKDLFLLLAVHYVFNLQYYNKVQELLLFYMSLYFTWKTLL